MPTLTRREYGLILGALYRAEAWEAEIADSGRGTAPRERGASHRLMMRYGACIEKIEKLRQGLAAKK